MLTHTRRSRAARFWAALAALIVVPATLAVSTSSAGAAGSNTLTVKAGEYTYQLKGSPKAGWTQINFDNAGVEDHMMVVLKLKKGATSAQFKKAIAERGRLASSPCGRGPERFRDPRASWARVRRPRRSPS